MTGAEKRAPARRARMTIRKARLGDPEVDLDPVFGAVAFHGHPRATKRLDVLVGATSANATLVYPALASFGAPLSAFEIDGRKVPVIGRSALLRNKRASGRAKDLADLKTLERVARRE